MALIEDSRVKIPAKLHVTMLGYTYLSLKGSRWDEANHIPLDLFHSSIAAKPFATGACSWPESVVRSKMVARDGKNQNLKRKGEVIAKAVPQICKSYISSVPSRSDGPWIRSGPCSSPDYSATDSVGNGSPTCQLSQITTQRKKTNPSYRPLLRY